MDDILLLGVNGFTLDFSTGEFMLTHRDIHIPKWGKVRAAAALYPSSALCTRSCIVQCDDDLHLQ